MAGGSRFFVYGSDVGDPYALLRDTSNTTAVNGAGNIYTAATKLNVLPRSVKARYAVFGDLANRRTVRVTILLPSTYIAMLKGTANQTLTDPFDGTTVMSLLYLTPEITRRAPRGGADTGLTGLGTGA